MEDEESRRRERQENDRNSELTQQYSKTIAVQRNEAYGAELEGNRKRLYVNILEDI